MTRDRESVSGLRPSASSALESAGARAYRAALVAPVGSAPIRGGVVVVDQGVIAYVGPEREAPTVPTVDLGDVVITPGFVNTHTHLDLTAYRGGVLDGLDFFGWIRTLTRSKATLSAEELLDAARAGIMAGLARGITTYADTSNSDAALDAMAELGVRGIAYREVFGPDPSAADAAMAELATHVGAMRARATHLVRVGVSPHAPYSVSDALFERVAAFARAERLPMAIHIAESEAETALVADGRGPFADFLVQRGIPVVPRAPTPIALLAARRALGEHTLLIHCVRVNADDLVTMARHGCGVAHCPQSNDWFGHGAAPLGAMLVGGVRVGMGTDSMGSNDGMDVLAEAGSSLARARAAAAGPVRAALDASDALTLATWGGACALRMEDTIGQLAPGFAADLAWFPLPLSLASGPTPSTADVGNALLTAGREAMGVIVAGTVRLAGGTPSSERLALEARVTAMTQRLHRWRVDNAAG